MGSDANAIDDEKFFLSSFGQRPRVSRHFGIPRRLLSKTKLLACLTFLVLIIGSVYVASHGSTDTDLLDRQFQITQPPASHTTKAATDFKHDDALKPLPKSQVPGAINRVLDDGRFAEGLAAKDDMAAAKENTAAVKENTVVKDDTTAVKDDTAAVKDDTAAVKDDTTAVKDDTAVVKDDTAAVKDDTTAVEDDTTAVKNDTMALKDDMTVVKDGTPPAKDDTAAIKQGKFSATEENAMVVVIPEDPAAKKPIADTSSSVSTPIITVKPITEEWKAPSEQAAEAKSKAALKLQPISTKQQAAGAKDKGKPLGAKKVSTAVKQTVCPEYAFYSQQQHLPLSGGPLNLPFQRPPVNCRKFESPAIEEVIKELGDKILDLDLAQIFRNCLPNTLDTTIAWFNNNTELPYSFVVTGDIPAMWLRDSTNQVLPYVAYAHKDPVLQTLLRGVILLQARYVDHNPYANAFRAPLESRIYNNGGWSSDQVYPPVDRSQVSEAKYEIDSLAAFLKISYQYWVQTRDFSFVRQGVWLAAAEKAVHTMRDQQQGTFDEQGAMHAPHYNFTRNGQSPTDTQFLGGNGQPVRYTGMVKSHFRPSDDSSVFPFFVPGNAMAAVELGHLAELLEAAKAAPELAQEAKALAGEIKEAIYKYAVVNHPQFGEIFAFEVDGYGSNLLMDDANIPSLLSLPYLGFVDLNDPIYQNTRKFVLSEANPYFFKGPLGSGVGGPHVGLGMAWPMSQIMRILTSQSDDEILDALKIIVSNTEGTGLMHEAFSVFNKYDYSRPWFAWSNTLFGEAVLEIASKRPSLLFEKKLNLGL